MLAPNLNTRSVQLDRYSATEADFQAFLGRTADEEALKKKGLALLDEARRWWEGLARYRTDRREARDFYRNRQWERWMTDEDGNRIREKDYLAAKGRVAVTMNIVQAALNNLQGQFRQNASERQAFAVSAADEEAVEMLNLARRKFRREVDSSALEADQFMEHAMSGMAAFRSTFFRDPRTGRPTIRDYGVPMSRFFFNADLADRRFDAAGGLRLVGQLHDVPFEEVVRRFAATPQDAERLKRVFAQEARGATFGQSGYGADYWEDGGFYSSSREGLCRVIEVWDREFTWQRHAYDPAFMVPGAALIPDGYGPLNMTDANLQAVQGIRRAQGLPELVVEPWEYAPVWVGYWLAPTGEVLKKMRSPYWHGEHPYTLGAALWLDGETWGVVKNLTDPQRWLNRVLTNIDHQMVTGAKGTTYYDQDVLENSDLTQADMDEARVRGDHSIALRKGGVPWSEVIHTESNQQLAAGYFEMVPLLVNFAERLSGISAAAQGLENNTSTTATQYERQVIQAGVNIYLFLDTFFETLRRKDRKEARLIQQAVTDPMVLRDEMRGADVVYDPERVRAMEFDFAMGSAANTPTQRMADEATLRADAEAGLLPYEVYLKHSSRPNAGKILADLQLFQAEQIEQAMLVAQLDAANQDQQDSQQPG